jgi:hypothetical protein
VFTDQRKDGSLGKLAQDASLIGNWRLVSFQTIVEGEASKDIYGAQPKGVLILTR